MIKGYVYYRDRDSFFKGNVDELIVFKNKVNPQLRNINIDESKFSVIDKIMFWIIKR